MRFWSTLKRPTKKPSGVNGCGADCDVSQDILGDAETFIEPDNRIRLAIDSTNKSQKKAAQIITSEREGAELTRSLTSSTIIIDDSNWTDSGDEGSGPDGQSVLTPEGTQINTTIYLTWNQHKNGNIPRGRVYRLFTSLLDAHK